MSLVVREEDVAYGLWLALSKKEQKKFMKIVKNQPDFFDFLTRMDMTVKKDIRNRERYNKFRMCYFFFLGVLFSANKMKFSSTSIGSKDIERSIEENVDRIMKRIQLLGKEIGEREFAIRHTMTFFLGQGFYAMDCDDQIEKMNSLCPFFKVFISSLLLGKNGFVRDSAVGTCYLLANIFLQKAEFEGIEDEEKKQIIAEAEEILREKEA